MVALPRSLLLAVLGMAVCSVTASQEADHTHIEDDISKLRGSFLSENQAVAKRTALPIDSLVQGAGLNHFGGKRAGMPIDPLVHGLGLPITRRHAKTTLSDQGGDGEKRKSRSRRVRRAAPIDPLYRGRLSSGIKRAAPIDSIYGRISLPISSKRASIPIDSIYRANGLPMSTRRAAAPIDAIYGGFGLPMSVKRAYPIDSIIGGKGLPIMNKRRTMAPPIDNIIRGYGLPISVRVGNTVHNKEMRSGHDGEQPWQEYSWQWYKEK